MIYVASVKIGYLRYSRRCDTQAEANEWLGRVLSWAITVKMPVKSPKVEVVITDEEQFGFLQGDACAAEWQASKIYRKPKEKGPMGKDQGSMERETATERDSELQLLSSCVPGKERHQ